MTDRMNSIPAAPLPLPEGGRPLFAGRALLESIQRSGAAGDPWMALRPGESRALAAAMCACAAMASRSGSAGSRLDPKLMRAVLELPLFLDRAQACEWEAARPWNAPGFGLSATQRLAHSELLESARPSDAYLEGEQSNQGVWVAWMHDQASSRLVSALESSAAALEAWSALGPAREECASACSWAAALGQALGLCPAACLAWRAFESACGHCDDAAGGAFALMAESHADARGFLRALSVALRLPGDALESLLSPGSPALRARLLPALDLAEPFPARQGWAKGWQESFGGRGWRAKLAAGDPSDPCSALAPPAPGAGLGLADWAHLGEPLASCARSLARGSAKILLWGGPGQGKSSLADALCREAGLSARVPSSSPKAEEDSRADDALLAAWLCSGAQAALVVESSALAPGAARAESIRKVQGAAQIWIAESLSGLPDSALRGFDAVLECKPMPLAGREAMAREIFGEGEVGARAARALRAPADLALAAKRCASSQDWSWKAVCGLVEELARARSSARGVFADSFPVVDVAGPIPELAGSPELTAMLASLGDALAEPARYAALGAKLPKGMLLLGPPGTGKTLFAKHLARSAGVPMIAPDSSALAGDHSRIKALFEQARSMAPCVVFLDEADALVGSPMGMMGPDLERQKIVNALLAELDGVDTSEGVLVLAATHRETKIDPAVTRSGRLGMSVRLRMPSKEARSEIWRAHLAGRPLEDGLDPAALGAASCGFSGADIAEAANKAALACAVARRGKIVLADLVSACDEVFWGAPDGSCVVGDHEKWATAIHEAGHALMAWRHGFEVVRVTARPRAQALGLTHWLDDEGTHTHAHGQLRARIEMALGGLAAEKVEFGFFANGGTSDLKFAKDVIYHALTEAGFGDQFSGMAPGFQGLWSEERKKAFEAEERAEMRSLFEAASAFLESQSELLRSMARELVARRELSGPELDPWRERCVAVSEESPRAQRRPAMPPALSDSSPQATLHLGALSGESGGG